MNAQYEQKIADKVYEVYTDLKPSLLALAYRYKAPNPQDTVDAWMSRAYEIVDRFDKGDLRAKVYANLDNQDELEAYNPDKHEQERFIKSLKNYLKQCFTNDIFKLHYKAKRSRDSQENAIGVATASYSQTGLSEAAHILQCDAITLDKLTKFIEKDYERTKDSSTCMLDVIHDRFLLAMVTFCRTMMARGEDWRNLVVVPDVDEEENKKFFSYDFRSELEEGVRVQLCKLLVKEENPIVIKKLAVLIDKDNRSALQKRLFRYLYEYCGGMPKRLRIRVKNKTL